MNGFSEEMVDYIRVWILIHQHQFIKFAYISCACTDRQIKCNFTILVGMVSIRYLICNSNMIEGSRLLLRRRGWGRNERLSRRNIVRMVDSSWIKMSPFKSSRMLVNNKCAKPWCHKMRTIAINRRVALKRKVHASKTYNSCILYISMNNKCFITKNPVFNLI